MSQIGKVRMYGNTDEKNSPNKVQCAQCQVLAVPRGIASTKATASGKLHCPNCGHVHGDIYFPKVNLITGITVTGAGGATTITVKNGTLQMSAATTPSNAKNQKMTWTVTNGTGAATISSTGLLTGVTNGNGTVTVTATANDGSLITGTLIVTLSNQ